MNFMWLLWLRPRPAIVMIISLWPGASPWRLRNQSATRPPPRECGEKQVGQSTTTMNAGRWTLASVTLSESDDGNRIGILGVEPVVEERRCGGGRSLLAGRGRLRVPAGRRGERAFCGRAH